MDVSYAKKITIIFLFFLNAVLFVCNILFADNNKYYMTNDQFTNITELLEVNNISFTGKAMRSFAPKGRIEMKPFNYNNEELLEIFMTTPDDAKLSIENNRQIYRTDWESISINANTGYVLYRNRDVTAGVPDGTYAKNQSAALLKKIRASYPDFISDMPYGQPYESEEGLVFEYRPTYRGYIISSSYLIITVGENGISRAEFIYAQADGFVNEQRSICSPDEVLLTCMHEIKNTYAGAGVSIDKMDLVYHRLENTGIRSAAIYAAPFYRVYISADTAPLLINAYTNTIYTQDTV
ncbi:MAG: hypothetical protein LBS21_00210 [Clostridiales bacterium]|jgi:hypothetical protein|nr:hypothetical protein [Clostridiales bacterium]